MKKQLCIFSLLLILGITAIQFIPILDDPNHLMKPDPDCPMCMAYQTPVLPGHAVCIGTIVINVAIIAETYVFNKYSRPFIPIFTIRAPPFSCFFMD
jgi:hypothetical protein